VSFDVFALQAISGHLDIASLARYINPKPKNLAKRLNEAFADAGISPDGGYRARTARNRPAGSDGRSAEPVIGFSGASQPRDWISVTSSAAVGARPLRVIPGGLTKL
jgi:hypothetical protein